MTFRPANLVYLLLACAVLILMGCTDAPEEADVPAESAPNEEMAAPDAAAPSNASKVNLNTATEEEFLAIPNVGDQMAHEFDEYRPYVSIQQFRQEIGKYVDEEQVAAYEEYVFVPVSPNESDEETLMQLPGVDAAAAAELAAARPYASQEAFLESLGEVVSADQVTQAEAYLAGP
jgi:DNA uptake protein ComE-like DNA-binding protein